MHTGQTVAVRSEVDCLALAGKITKLPNGRFLTLSAHFGPEGGISFKSVNRAAQWLVEADRKVRKPA